MQKWLNLVDIDTRHMIPVQGHEDNDYGNLDDEDDEEYGHTAHDNGETGSVVTYDALEQFSRQYVTSVLAKSVSKYLEEGNVCNGKVDRHKVENMVCLFVSYICF